MPPLAATILSLLLPGSAHLALGRPVRGLVAMGSVLGLFWIGALGLGDRLFHFVLVDMDLGRVIPINLLPDWFNFLSTEAMRLSVDTSSDLAQRAMREPREGEHLFGLLTGLAGWMSVLWSADAWWIARQKASLDSSSGASLEDVLQPAPGSRVTPGTALLATWFCPGLGQWLAGHRSKGIAVGAAVWLLFLGGLVFAEGHAVDRPLQPAWWIAQSLHGGGVTLAALITGPMRMESVPEFHLLGIVLCASAGLVNVSGMLDAWRIAGGRWGEGAAPSASRGTR